MTTNVWKALGPVIAILALVLGGLFVVKSLVGERHGGVQLVEGAQVPEFKLVRMGGGEITPADLKAKVLMINFWASWCEACMVEMPSIVALRKAYAERGFEVAAVNVDENPEAVVPGILAKFKIEFPVFIDQDQKLSRLFDVHGIPFTVILDSERRILFLETGERDWNAQEIRARMERWLNP